MIHIKYTNTSGMASYYEVCSLLNSGWTRIYNEEQQVPYIYNGNQWIGYDDEQSLTQKVFFFF
jgi:GH18 family chitinase